MDFIKLSKKELEKESKKLYKKIISKYNYDLVIFIARGSYYIGDVLAKENKVPLLEIKATRKGNKIKNIIKPLLKLLPNKIIKKLREKEMGSSLHSKNSDRQISYNQKIYNQYIGSKRILVVDDSIDTGYSVLQVIENLKKIFKNSDIKIASLNFFNKAKDVIIPDFYLYADTMLQGPWSNDSKEYDVFISDYNKWYNEYENSDSSVSVAMATYNGEKYIKEQIDSILLNLSDNDEVIISDDGSTDKTLKIIKEYQKKDSRIKLFVGPKQGVKQNFANAISKCENSYIFLADQDDIWMEDKVKIVLETFKKNNCLVVQHDCSLINQKKEEILNSYFNFRKCGRGIIKNLYKNTYIGCCMAFKKELVSLILPIPNNIDMHDQWIGMLGDKKSVFIKDKLIYYRRHEGTVSDCFHHHPLKTMIKDRFNLVVQFIRRIKK